MRHFEPCPKPNENFYTVLLYVFATFFMYDDAVLRESLLSLFQLQ